MKNYYLCRQLRGSEMGIYMEKRIFTSRYIRIALPEYLQKRRCCPVPSAGSTIKRFLNDLVNAGYLKKIY